jgi:hypothetical protein
MARRIRPSTRANTCRMLASVRPGPEKSLTAATKRSSLKADIASSPMTGMRLTFAPSRHSKLGWIELIENSARSTRDG